MRKIAIASTLALLFFACPLLATTADDVLKALEGKIKITHVNLWSQNISTPGTVLVVQKDGLAVGAIGDLNKKTVIKNGELVSAGGGQLFGGLLGGGGNSGHDLKRGEKVYLYEDRVNAKKDGLTLRIITVGTYDVNVKGETKSQRGDLQIEFWYDRPLADMTTDQVLGDLSKWFRTEDEASESATVKLGQTPEEVEEILGKPDKRIDLGAKKVYVYKDMKIVFVEGKVSDVQ